MKTVKTSLLIVTSLLSTSLQIAHADQSPEMNFLAQTIAIGGERLSNDELQKELGNAAQTYLNSAPTDGREDRMEEALVQMNVMTADQARYLKAVADQAALKGDRDAQTKLVLGAAQQALIQAKGAQFSGCDAVWTFEGALMATSITFIVIGATHDPNADTKAGHTASSELVGGMIGMAFDFFGLITWTFPDGNGGCGDWGPYHGPIIRP